MLILQSIKATGYQNNYCLCNKIAKTTSEIIPSNSKLVHIEEYARYNVIKCT